LIFLIHFHLCDYYGVVVISNFLLNEYMMTVMNLMMSRLLIKPGVCLLTS